MRLLLDEMFPARVAIQLRARGYDVIAVTERSDLRSQPDNALLGVAQREGFAIVTENATDFRRLARVTQHPGLIFTTDRQFSRRDPRTAGRLVLALEALLVANPSILNTEVWLTRL